MIWNENCNAFFYLFRCFIALYTALAKLKIAYQLGSKQKVKYINDILQALLLARKKKWDDDEIIRIEKESELLHYVKQLVVKDYTQQLNEVDENDQEKIEEIKYNMVNIYKYMQ